jgi:hypothetical protein
MLEQDILKHPTSILSATQREQYFEEGAVLVEGVVPEVWLKRLRAASDEIIDHRVRWYLYPGGRPLCRRATVKATVQPDRPSPRLLGFHLEFSSRRRRRRSAWARCEILSLQAQL